MIPTDLERPRLAPWAVSISWRAHQLLRLALAKDLADHVRRADSFPELLVGTAERSKLLSVDKTERPLLAIQQRHTDELISSIVPRGTSCPHPTATSRVQRNSVKAWK